jgi:hypothetical protein
MRRGFRISRLTAAGIASIALAFTTVTIMGQARTKDVKAVKISSAVPNIPTQNPFAPNTTPVPLNTMDGHPDLNGMWQYRTSTPMARPQNLGTTLFYKPEEGEALGKRITEQRNADVITDKVEVEAYQKGMNTVWFEYGGPLLQYRTSLIVDPPDGRMPVAANSPEAIALVKAGPYATAMGDRADSAKDRTLRERCMVVGNGPPWGVDAWNNEILIVHRKDSVVLQTEMVHTARTVWLDGRPHIASNVPQWAGDSRGHWEGDTLIIETTNFRPESRWLNVLHPEKFKLVERLTRIDGDTVLYEYTMNDPETYAKPYTVQIPMSRFKGQMFEYSCHEGNKGLFFQMSAARAAEKAAASKK